MKAALKTVGGNSGTTSLAEGWQPSSHMWAAKSIHGNTIQPMLLALSAYENGAGGCFEDRLADVWQYHAFNAACPVGISEASDDCS